MHNRAADGNGVKLHPLAVPDRDVATRCRNKLQKRRWRWRATREAGRWGRRRGACQAAGVSGTDARSPRPVPLDLQWGRTSFFPFPCAHHRPPLLMLIPRAVVQRDSVSTTRAGGGTLAILLRATGGATAQGPLSLQFGAACVVRVGGRARVCAKLLGMAPASGSAVLSACLLCFVCAKLFGRRPLRGLLSLRCVCVL